MAKRRPLMSFGLFLPPGSGDDMMLRVVIIARGKVGK